MLTDNRADFRTQDWFLIACEGDLVLKLAQDLMIGEDERGQTVLSPAREDALLRITSEHGCLTLQAMAMDWTFSENGGLAVQHLTFVDGHTLKLNFPNSTLLITPDFRAGARAAVDREIRLAPTDTPTLTLTRVEPLSLVEPASLIEPELPPASAEPLAAEELVIEEAMEQVRAAEALTRWDHEIPDELVDGSEEADEAEEEPAALADRPAFPILSVPGTALPGTLEPEPAVAEATEPPTESKQEPLSDSRVVPLRRQHHRPLTGFVAAMALLAPMCLFLADTSKLGVAFSLTNYIPLQESTPASVQNHPQPRAHETPAEALPAEAVPVEAPALEPSPAPADQEERNEAERLLIASLLAEAKAYLEAGSIVTPVQANAVSNLTQVLSIDPSNKEGLQLMYLSAVTLIEEAEAAHAAGDDYLARNLVEDVLGFHPEFDDARALLDSWTRVP